MGYRACRLSLFHIAADSTPWFSPMAVEINEAKPTAVQPAVSATVLDDSEGSNRARGRALDG